MGLPSPSKRKPTVSEVVAWALTIAKMKRTINVDGKWGGQCWDLPNYILKKYWGFFTWGNANAMAQKSNYRGYNFKIYRNTKNFVPKPGDWAVWANQNPGHVSIVVGKSTKDYFWSVDQNYYTGNWSGSPPYKIKHKYTDAPGGVTHFVRPPYHPEPKKENPSKGNESSKNNTPTETKKDNMPRFKNIINITYTSFRDDKERENVTHYIVDGNKRTSPIKGLYIKESIMFRSVKDIYKQRNKYNNDIIYPHSYVDKDMTWHCRHTKFQVESYYDWIVLEVCGSESETKEEYMRTLIYAMIHGLKMLEWNDLKLSENSLKLDENIWRIMKDTTNYDLILKGYPELEKYQLIIEKLITMYRKKDDLLKQEIVTKKSKKRIKLKPATNNVLIKKPNNPPTQNKEKSKVDIEISKYTFTQALNAQMAKGLPVVNTGGGWFNASRAKVSAAMDPNKIWSDSKQKYQMLNLGKYQGVSVDKLNQILKGKGKLHGQGKAFADSCKKHNVNEIYIISHAFLESGYGTSNFASGRYGIYNFFGINAYDNNPNLAISYAKNRGWTTPAKGILGGTKFVRENYFNKGKNTLYRMRWNPRNPGTMQYATDINWCKHQASMIYSLYKDVGLVGLYFIRDKYK